MEKDYINILVFGHTTFGIRPLRVKKETFRIAAYLLIFLQISVTFFFCDYVQVRKKTFQLNQLRQESQIQKSHIQLFSTKIKELENKLSRLKDINYRIRIIANLERGRETLPFIGMGGSSPSTTRGKSVSPGKSAEEPRIEKLKREEPQETALINKGDATLYPDDLPAEASPEPQ